MTEEVRCPMCSKLNPPDSEVCGFCGARIKPLVLGPAPDEARQAPAMPPAAESESAPGGDDWLARMRDESGKDVVADDTPGEMDEAGGSPDWLGRLREVQPAEEGPPEGEIPAWLEEQAAEVADETASAPPEGEGGAVEPAEIPDWLARVRERQAQEGDLGAEEAAEEEPTGLAEEDWLARIRDSGEPVGQGLPTSDDSLARPVQEEEREAPPAPAPAGMETGVSERGGGGEGTGAEEGLAWAEDSGMDMSWLEEVQPEETPDLAGPPEEAAEASGWLSELEGVPDEIGSRDESGAVPWLGDAEIVAEKPFTGEDEAIGVPEPEAGEADWLKELEQGGDQPSSWQDQASAGIWEAGSESSLEWLADYDASTGRKPAEEQDAAVPDSGEGAPDWLSELNQPGEPTPEEHAEAPTAKFEEPPEPVPPEEEAPEEALPHVPALVLGDARPGAPSAGQDFDLGSIEVELPDWLGEQKIAGTGAEAESGQPGAGLAPATLPAWLEAMRPISTFRSVVDTVEEEEGTLESAGPLAGLRGVLMAEPVMAMPRAPTIGSAKLEITDRQYAQADLLHKMVAEEAEEAPAPAARRLRVPILRWIVSAALLVSVILPIATGVPSFALPTQVSRDLDPLISLVNSLPVDRPSLIVFDFDPGYSGELDAVAGAFLDQVMGRGIPVVSLSTRPSGPALAVGLLDRIAARHGISAGSGYVHLGYLSGGSTAVQIFSAAPRDAVRRGFDLPKDAAGEDICSGWDCPILAGVERLSGFGMVAVISSGTENARIWAEQAHPFMGQVPLVMVLSAGAEPLIRPYYEALRPQVNGILSGLPSAVAYEQANVMPGEAHSRWNPFGAALAVTEALLAAGLVYGLLRWFVRIGRPSRE